jgi:hypothetical protein
VNDLPKVCDSAFVNKYADDTQLYCSADTPEQLQNILTDQLSKLECWFAANKLKLNVDKTLLLVCGSNRNLKKFANFNFHHSGKVIIPSPVVRILGVIFDSGLNWTTHIESLAKTAWSRAFLIRKCSPFLPVNASVILYNALVASLFNYCDSVWDNCGKTLQMRLQRIQNFCARNITSTTRSAPANQKLGWLPLYIERKIHRLSTFFKSQNGIGPRYLLDNFKPSKCAHVHNTRFTATNKFCPRAVNTTKNKNSYVNSTIRDWNELPEQIRAATSHHTFVDAVTHLYKVNYFAEK